MVVRIAHAAQEKQEDLLRSLRREKKDTSDLFVVIYVNGADETGTQTAAVAKIVGAIQRRMGAAGTEPDVLAIADLRLDRNRHEVTRAGMPIHLSPMEYALLEYLLLHRDCVQTEAVLMDAVFGGGQKSGRFNTLWVHMHRLRKKLDEPASVRLMHTIRGVGYILKTPPADEALPA